MDTLDDGGLLVAPITGHTAPRDGAPGGERHGESMTLPADYVAQHVALGFASTVHAAQGVTVDTCHTVATTATGVEALYVGMTRGRHANTAHVVTRAVPNLPDGTPTGHTLQAVHRSPQAVLAGAFETADPQLSALAQAAQSDVEAEAVRTPAELFADAAELATAGRTATWLDELVTDGTLTEDQRVRLAAEDGAATFTTLLRRVELAGHNPRKVLRDAVTSRQLDDARQITNVIHRRITETTTLDPVGDSYAGWVPKLDDPQWDVYLTSLAEAADQRRVELGRQAAIDAPQWAVEALGPVPASKSKARERWEAAAAIAAAHRELVSHNDPADALGPAPKAGQTEAYASWRAEWRALGRPEAHRAEAEMSTGQLRVRIRAYDREQTWSPAYVANELAGTRQAAQRHRQDAAVRAAEATATAEPKDRRRLEAEADQAAALADALDARIVELEAVDEARAQWYAHTAETRAAADRARAELTARQAAADVEAERDVTADDWLAEHHAADAAEDPHREIAAEHDLADTAEAREHDQRIAVTNDQATDSIDDAHDSSTVGEPTKDNAARPPVAPRLVGDATSTAPLDIRQEAAAEPARDDGHDPDAVRVPTSTETSESVRRAHRALAEMKQRQVIANRHAADEVRERDDELARWHTDDPSTRSAADERDKDDTDALDHDPAHDALTTDSTDDFAPVLEVSTPDDY
jgi:hypothetical protein